MFKKLLLLAFTILSFCSLSFSKGKEPSSMFRGDQEHSGTYRSKFHNHFGKTKWKFKTQGKIFSSPAISDGIAYIGSEDKNLYAVDIRTGRLKWKFQTGGAVHSSPAVSKGTVYFLSMDGNFYALDAKTGEKKWNPFKTGGEKLVGATNLWGMQPADQYMEDFFDFFLSSPAVDESSKNPTVYFGSSDGNLYALDLKTGKKKWAFKTGGIIHTSPALSNGIVYIGSWDKHMYAVDARTGQEIWKFKTNDDLYMGGMMEGIQASPVVSDGMVFFGARDGFFYARNAKTGDRVWEYYTGGSWVVSSAAIRNGTVYITTSDTYELIAMNAKTGAIKFKFRTKGNLFSSPAIAGNTAYFGDFTGRMIALDLGSEGKNWDEFRTESGKINDEKVLDEMGEVSWAKLFGDKDPYQYTSNTDGMMQLFSLGPIVSSPVVENGIVYFGSADGNFYAVELKRKPAPFVAIASPDFNSVYKTGAPVNIRLITSNRKQITKVEYYTERPGDWGMIREKIGETDGKTESFTWHPSVSADYTIKVIITVKTGLKALDMVSVKVTDEVQSATQNTLASKPGSMDKKVKSSGATQNTSVYPNPFADQTTIKFTLENDGYTKVSIYGKLDEMTTLTEGYMEAGTYEFVWGNVSLPPGIYYCKINSDNNTSVIRIIKN